jgi:hypothetical protein
MLGWSIVFGAEITTNLLMWKICHFKLEYSSEICANLSAGQKHFKLLPGLSLFILIYIVLPNLNNPI